jgi:Uma2 family endonuclease
MATTTPTRPLLVAGDQMSRREFHERYLRMPPGVRAELIGGVVYIDGDGSMPSPVGLKHLTTTGRAGAWLGYYSLRTPGVRVGDNGTIFLGDDSKPQPDNFLWIDESAGGRVRGEGGFLVGAPELVVEVSSTSKARDRVQKRADYERAGVLEYIVFALDPDEIFWHRLRDGRLEPVGPDADGLHRSTAFPGLWLDPSAFWRDDGPTLLATLELGLASPEYTAFRDRLRAVGRGT